jgi:hypothetical protein
MQKISSKLLAVTLIMFLLSSCGDATPSPDLNAEMTAAVSTMVASIFGTQTAMVTPVTPTATQTYTPFPTITPFYSTTPVASATYIYYAATLGSLTPGSATPTGTQATATVNPGLLGVGCNNLYFIRDVTIPAGTVLQKNQDFTKTWKVQNNGTCDWLYQYSIVLLSGDAYGGKSTKIQRLVKVNGWTELSVSMTAPSKPGTYTSYWRLSNGQSMFGSTLAVSFVVSGPPTSTSAPTITNTSAPIPTNTITFTPAPTDTPTETPTATP